MFGGSIRLFRVAGIQVSLHFSWFLVAVYQITSRRHDYDSQAFAAYEYLALFLIVLLHEFGHAFACRQVGGEANNILLWPFGGIAFVQPPPRAGAQLWSIAAGPLVNVALIPVLEGLRLWMLRSGSAAEMPDLYQLIYIVSLRINLGLLIFNMLPLYPLDGGQILRSLLWFPCGRILSLQIASVIGLLGGVALGIFALVMSQLWLAFLMFFLLSQALAGWRRAKAMRAEEDQPTPPVETLPAERPPAL